MGRPKCFGDYTGKVACLKCRVRKSCVNKSEEDDEKEARNIQRKAAHKYAHAKYLRIRGRMGDPLCLTIDDLELAFIAGCRWIERP